jgi:UDP-N-acetylmuramate--alanine ligase
MFNEYTHVHFVGIGGIGMSALAKWFLREGVSVSGSDVHTSEITDNLAARGAVVHHGHSVENVDESVDLLIYSSAVLPENVERTVARERGICEMTNFEFLGEVSKDFFTIVVCGTNGKSTTTAMLGLILEAAGLDPTVLVGSLVPSFADGNLRVGKGKFFVVEGCEYKANMLNLAPSMIVVTNIEEDHLDYYRDLAHIQATFQQFVDKLKVDGKVVFNACDIGSTVLKIKSGISFGGSSYSATYAYQDRVVMEGAQKVEVIRGGAEDILLGVLELKVPGDFNVMNALAAISAALELGVSFDVCARALAKFRGLWRRFERVGVWKGADVISDYGHHPSAIKQTIQAAREFFPGRRIVLCYQPHQHDRTKKLFNEFVEVLPLADHLVIAEIYDVAGRNEDHDVSSRDLVEAIKNHDPAKDVKFAKDKSAAEDILRDIVKPGDILIIMGAGDIDELARKLSNYL